MKIRNLLAIALIAIGSLQMIGYFAQSKILRGLGLASGVSPFPKVFSEADGYEAFAASFEIHGTTPDGKPWKRQLDPAWYANLTGPYNRRNVYGAALAFAPRLPEKLRDTLLQQALSTGSAMRNELQIPGELTGLEIQITPRSGEREGPWNYNYHQP